MKLTRRQRRQEKAVTKWAPIIKQCKVEDYLLLMDQFCKEAGFKHFRKPIARWKIQKILKLDDIIKQSPVGMLLNVLTSSFDAPEFDSMKRQMIFKSASEITQPKSTWKNLKKIDDPHKVNCSHCGDTGCDQCQWQK